MGTKLFDQYTYLHFASGIVSYFWNLSFIIWIIIHTIFEICENTQTCTNKMCSCTQTKAVELVYWAPSMQKASMERNLRKQVQSTHANTKTTILLECFSPCVFSENVNRSSCQEAMLPSPVCSHFL